jgi:hypothetical protein
MWDVAMGYLKALQWHSHGDTNDDKNNSCVKQTKNGRVKTMSPANIHTVSASRRRLQYLFNGKVSLTHL